MAQSKHRGGIGVSESVQAIDWSVVGGQVGLGVIVGYAVGFTVKKALKVALVIIGILVVLGVSLQSQGFITVHWGEIEGAYLRAMGQSGGLRPLMEAWAARMDTLIPLTGSFAVGFFLGLRRG